MHEGCRELDQALEERPLAEIVRAHPGRLEQLVGLEEVTAVVGRQAFGEGAAPLVERNGPICLGPAAGLEDGPALAWRQLGRLRTRGGPCRCRSAAR